MTLADELNTVAEETKGEGRIKTAELVNLTFTINGYAVENKTTKEGAPVVDDMGVQLVSYVGHIVLDGEERDAWLDGQTVRPQLQKIKERNAFPVKVKLTMDEKRYVLRVLDEPVTATLAGDVPTGVTVAPATSHKAALAAYMTANGVKASAILRANKVIVKAEDDIAALWSNWMEKEMALGVISEEEVCRQVLSELEATAQADASAIPFGD